MGRHKHPDILRVSGYVGEGRIDSHKGVGIPIPKSITDVSNLRRSRDAQSIRDRNKLHLHAEVEKDRRSLADCSSCSGWGRPDRAITEWYERAENRNEDCKRNSSGVAY